MPLHPEPLPLTAAGSGAPRGWHCVTQGEARKGRYRGREKKCEGRGGVSVSVSASFGKRSAAELDVQQVCVQSACSRVRRAATQGIDKRLASNARRSLAAAAPVGRLLVCCCIVWCRALIAAHSLIVLLCGLSLRFGLTWQRGVQRGGGQLRGGFACVFRETPSTHNARHRAATSAAECSCTFFYNASSRSCARKCTSGWKASRFQQLYCTRPSHPSSGA